MLPRLAIALALACSCREAPPTPTAKPEPKAASSAPAAVRSAETGQDHVVLVFAASQAGQLVPCGCSPDQRGGLPRAAALLAKMRERDPQLVFIDAGDALLASASAPAGPAATQAELKAATLARGDALLGAQARVLGPRDLALGSAFAASSADGVPLLDAGGAPVPGARASLLLRAGEVPIGVFAAGLGEDPAKTIAARTAELRSQGARIVVLVVQPRGDRALAGAESLLPAARAAGVDLAVLGRRDDPETDPEHTDPGTPPLFALEGHGRELLRIDLMLPRGPGTPQRPGVFLAQGAAGKTGELKEIDERIALTRDRVTSAPPELRALLQAKIVELESRKAKLAAAVESAPPGAIVAKAAFIPVEKGAGENVQAAALVAAYDAQVSAQNLAAAKKLPARCPRPGRGEAAYTGVSAKVADGESCATCHATEAAFWERTPHARAYASLANADKQFSLDCIQCHVTGWQQPGGVCRIDLTAQGGPGLRAQGSVFGLGRRDVQCEMCHGPASLHAEEPPEHIAARVPEQVCKRCHEAENSPRFDYAKYRPFIIGPGHGEPLALGAQPRSRGEIETGQSGPNAALKRASP